MGEEALHAAALGSPAPELTQVDAPDEHAGDEAELISLLRHAATEVSLLQADLQKAQEALRASLEREAALTAELTELETRPQPLADDVKEKKEEASIASRSD